jgi:NAD(P)-dependent dehydrogenase (short-subunit alcohol dehydrogenase family)
MSAHERQQQAGKYPRPDFRQQDQDHPGADLRYDTGTHLPEGRSVIDSTSVQAYEPKPHLLGHATSTRAIVTATQGRVTQLAGRGIRVNAVTSGPVRTPLIPSTLPDTSEFGKQAPFRRPARPARPAEMAPAYVFLSSEDTGCITAEIMNATEGTPLP